MSGLAETRLSDDYQKTFCIGARIFNLDCWSHVEKLDQILEHLPKMISERLEVLGSGDELRKVELLSLFVDEADDFFDRLEELQSLFGLESCPNSRESLIQGWRALHAAGVLIQNIKYTVNLAFNRHFDVEEMPKPIQFQIGLQLFPQALRNSLGRMRSDEKRWKKKSLYLINSLFQGWKKGLLPLSPDAFIKTMSDHQKNLCDTDGTIPSNLHVEFRRIMDDLFSSGVNKHGRRKSFKFVPSESSSSLPSSSATIESKRGNNGSLGKLVDKYLGYSHYHRHNFSSEDAGGDIYNKIFDSCFPFLAGYLRDKHSPKVTAVYYWGPCSSEVKEWEYNVLRNENKKYEDDDFESYEPEVSPYGVLEPLKIRTITRPNWKTHFGLNSVQKQLFRYLSKLPEFSIIGDSNRENLIDHIEPLLRVDDWVDAVEPSPFWGKEEENSSERFFRGFGSGDFSAASDKVKRQMTELAWESASKTMPKWIRKKTLRSLTRTTIIYDEEVFPKLSKFDPFFKMELPPFRIGVQENGQLMGHKVSFPLLNVINYAVWHRSMEIRFDTRLSVDQMRSISKSKFNGDDCAFRTDPKHWAIWKGLAAECGLEQSQGKSFYSEDFLQINSQLFKIKYKDHDKDNDPIGFELINYFNFGQLTGRKKGMNSSECRLDLNGPFFSNNYINYPDRIAELSSVRKNFSEMYTHAPTKKLKEQTLILQHKWFNRRFKSLLTPEMYACLSLPFELGGLGFGGVMPKKIFNLQDNPSCFFKKCSDGFDLARKYYPGIFALSRFTMDDHPQFIIGRPYSTEHFPGTSVLKDGEVDWVKDYFGKGLVPLPV